MSLIYIKLEFYIYCSGHMVERVPSPHIHVQLVVHTHVCMCTHTCMYVVPGTQVLITSRSHLNTCTSKLLLLNHRVYCTTFHCILKHLKHKIFAKILIPGGTRRLYMFIFYPRSTSRTDLDLRYSTDCETSINKTNKQ